MTRRSVPLRALAAVAAATLAATLVASAPAVADEDTTSGNRYGTSGNCTMYANGAGMGSYCFGSIGDLLTLAERFGGMPFQPCRYEQPPPSMLPEYEVDEDGDWHLRTCLRGIDWQTYSGGPERTVNISVVWLPSDYDTSYPENALSRFLWDNVPTQFPVPMMVTQPSTLPRVHEKAYITFHWLDPRSHEVVAEGPYADEEFGGPFVRERNGSLTMTARGTDVVVDPQVDDTRTVECGPNPVYDETLAYDEQTSECFLNYAYSSAEAEEHSDFSEEHGQMPHVFFARIKVNWRVDYDNGFGNTRGGSLGDFQMVVHQPVPVREVQALNLPVWVP